jgi:vacuolar protein sorting-associated protein 35
VLFSPGVFEQALGSRGDVRDERTERQIVDLLSLPLTAYDPVTVLGLSTYPRVMDLLKPATRKVTSHSDLPLQTAFSVCIAAALTGMAHCMQAVAVKIVETILKQGTEISEAEQVNMLLDFIAPLVADSADLEGLEDEEVCLVILDVGACLGRSLLACVCSRRVQGSLTVQHYDTN